MDTTDRLELFFSQSLDGFFFMMLDEPVRWDDSVDKDAVLDYVFEHQRMTQGERRDARALRPHARPAARRAADGSVQARSRAPAAVSGGSSSTAGGCTSKPTSGVPTARR